MTPPPIAHTRRVLVVWVLLIVAGFVLTQVFNVLMARYAQRAREGDYRTYLAAATDLMSRFDLPGALEQVEEAKRRDPNAPEPDAMAGHIQYQLKHWEQAIAEYKRAIEKDSREEGVRLNSVWALIELKRHDEAAAVGAAAMHDGFATLALPRYVAEAHFRAGKSVEAIPYFEQALQGYSNDLYLLDHLRQAYVAAKQGKKAEEIQARITDVEATLNRAQPAGAGAPALPTR